MQYRAIEVLARNYLKLVEIASDFYAEGELALHSDNYNEASILQNQGDRVFELAVNIEAIISEQQG